MECYHRNKKRIMSQNILFVSENTIKSRTGVSDAIDGKQLKPQIKIAQDMYVQPTLGSTLYLRLQSGIEAGNLNVNETTLLDNYVTDCLVWYTMSLLPFALGYQFFSKGVLQKTSEESNTPSRSDLELISTQYKQTAEFYKQRMISYLKQNYSLYSEYFTPGNGMDVIFPENKAYTCPIYLGGSVPSEARMNGASSQSGVTETVYITPSEGVSTFTVTAIANKVVVIASRSGGVRGVTNAATSNTLYLQINGAVVTLPTGDVTQAGELFSFTYR